MELTVEQSDLLARWHAALASAAAAKEVIAAEQALRKQVGELFFPTPEEGTNSVSLPEGWVLKMTYKIDRKLDESALETVRAQLWEMNVNPDPLVETKFSLALKAYRGLVITNPEAAKVFDQALTIKPASPSVELVEPKMKG